MGEEFEEDWTIKEGIHKKVNSEYLKEIVLEQVSPLRWPAGPQFVTPPHGFHLEFEPGYMLILNWTHWLFVGS